MEDSSAKNQGLDRPIIQAIYSNDPVPRLDLLRSARLQLGRDSWTYVGRY